MLPRVLPAVARAFGVQPGRRDLAAVLADLLRPSQLLLVLDNCEQVATAAPALSALLAACPRLTILATSRASLLLTAEQAFPVPPLGLPEEQRLPPLAALRHVEAVALFLARARAVQPDFDLTVDNAAAVAAICRRLDGLPLALELAAARVRLLPPAALLRRLEHRLALLTTGPLDLPVRQRTLRATLAWSYDLLRPTEQALFRRLGVFAGGATLEMAEHVVKATGPLDGDVLEGLDALVRHSLVRQDEQEGEPRFGMLETVREFALEQLVLTQEVEPTRAAHVEALLHRLDGEQGPQGRSGIALTIPQLERERENLRLALGRCAEHDDSVRGLRLATLACPLWARVGPRAEGLSWLQRFLPPADLPAALRLSALQSANQLASRLDDRALVRAYVAEGLALAEALQDEFALVFFHTHTTGLALREGNLAAAQSAAEWALGLARRIGSDSMQGVSLMQLGTVAQLRGDAAGAAARYQEALVHLQGGRNWQWVQRNLGYLALEAGQPAEAAARFHAALREVWGQRGDSAVLETLSALGSLARERGGWVRAARLLGAVDAGLERLGGDLAEPIGDRERERTLAAAREQLGEPAFAAAYAAGRALPLEQAVAVALAADGDG